MFGHFVANPNSQAWGTLVKIKLKNMSKNILIVG